MKPPRRIVVGMSSAALALGSGTGIATAAHRGVHGGRNGDLPSGALVIASYLGLTGDELPGPDRQRQDAGGDCRCPGEVGRRARGRDRRRDGRSARRGGRRRQADGDRAGGPARRSQGARRRARHLGRTARRRRAGEPRHRVLPGPDRCRDPLAACRGRVPFRPRDRAGEDGCRPRGCDRRRREGPPRCCRGRRSAERGPGDGAARRDQGARRGAGATGRPAPRRRRRSGRGRRVRAGRRRPLRRHSPVAVAAAGRQRGPGPGAAPICRVPPVAVPSSGLRLAACVVARRRCRLSARPSRRHEGSAESRAHLDERRSSGATAPDPFRVSFSSIRRSRDAHQPNRRQRPPFRGLGPPRPARRHRPGRGVRGALPPLPAGRCAGRPASSARAATSTTRLLWLDSRDEVALLLVPLPVQRHGGHALPQLAPAALEVVRLRPADDRVAAGDLRQPSCGRSSAAATRRSGSRPTGSASAMRGRGAELLRSW